MMRQVDLSPVVTACTQYVERLDIPGVEAEQLVTDHHVLSHLNQVAHQHASGNAVALESPLRAGTVSVAVRRLSPLSEDQLHPVMRKLGLDPRAYAGKSAQTDAAAVRLALQLEAQTRATLGPAQKVVQVTF